MLQDLQVSITQQHLHTEISSKKGKYLPISVWKEQGYKTDNIVKNCPSKYDTQLEEMTYMLRVEEEIEDKIRKDVVDMLEAQRTKGKKYRLWKGASPSPAKAKQRSKEEKKGTKRPRSSSPSPSSSSSSSSQSSNGSKKSTRSNKSKEPSTPAKQTPKTVKTERKEKSIKDKQERIQKQQEMQKLKLEAKAKALKDKQVALKEREAEKKVKALEAEKVSQERPMSFFLSIPVTCGYNRTVMFSCVPHPACAHDSRYYRRRKRKQRKKRRLIKLGYRWIEKPKNRKLRLTGNSVRQKRRWMKPLA